MGSLEKRYAEALLSLTDSASQADRVGAALSALGRLFVESPELRGFVLNPVISRQVRGETLLDILEMLGFMKRRDYGYAGGVGAEPDVYEICGEDAEDDIICEDAEDVIDCEDAEDEIVCEDADEDIICGGAEDDIIRDGAEEIICDGADNENIREGADNENSGDGADDDIGGEPAGLLLSRFLRLLLDKGRLAFLPNIAEEYGAIKANHRNVLRVTVRSAAPLDGDSLDRIRDKYKRQYGAVLAEVENVIEPSLIGGLTVQIGDLRIDDTIYGRLASLARAIAAGAAKQTVEAG